MPAAFLGLVFPPQGLLSTLCPGGLAPCQVQSRATVSPWGQAAPGSFPPRAHLLTTGQCPKLPPPSHPQGGLGCQPPPPAVCLG